MEGPIQPIILLADSQLLFWRDDEGELFLERIRQKLEPESPKAAYIGASNGDQLEFYRLFQGAMEGIRVTDCRMIPSEPDEEDMAFLEVADLILLAGGNPESGWRIFEESGIKQKIIERYYTGAVLIGISAGAMQLGLYGFREGPTANGPELFETFKLVPLVIDAHQEPEWTRLRAAMPEAGDLVQGLGLPTGGGAIIESDMTIEPIRRPLAELSLKGDEIRQNLILPPDGNEDEEEASTSPQLVS